ncbi:Hsp20/alpha crystallin family protein [Candidatus Parcubacteria bacterium]|nr:Hsp20/alpha crystallin family protein [Candidatus Parcubacteria bacterium]
MTKQKKSFLSKVTDFDKDEKVETMSKDENKINIEDTNEENTNEDKFRDSVDENSSEKEKMEEKWITDEESTSDEEGQLTVDVYKTKDLIIIKSIIGGVRPEDLDISVTSDMVTIKGKRSNSNNVVPDDYYYQECFWGNFSRSIILPNDIKTEGVEATIKNGILTVKLPKIEKNSSMKIEVKSE